MEMALWSLLGPRGVDVLVWESFSKGWAADITGQLKLPDVRVLEAPYGALPDLAAVEPARDTVFVWNGTTSGVRVPDGDWIAADRGGLTICDATSAAFAMDLPWDKLDVVTWSWQKCLGGEAAHGMIALGPRAVARLLEHAPAWPVPKLMRLVKGGKLDEGLFTGATINTPSLLCVEDWLDALAWAESVGGLPALIARAEGNLAAIAAWVGGLDGLRLPGRRSGRALVHLGVPEHHGALVHGPARRGAADPGVAPGQAAGTGGRGLRRGRLPGRPAGPAHLGRTHGGTRRPGSPATLAGLGPGPGGRLIDPAKGGSP